MENILLAERALLYTLAFDLQAMQPFNELSACFQRLGLGVAEHEGVAKMDDKAANLLRNTNDMILSRCMRGWPSRCMPRGSMLS